MLAVLSYLTTMTVCLFLCGPAFSEPIHDAAKAGDLTLLKQRHKLGPRP
jgi:hypothetical protein